MGAAISKPINLLRALATISGLTLISRILGFVRDFVIANIFGAGIATDAFFVAFKLPNLLRRIFAEGAFSQAFVPILSEYRNQHGHAKAKILVKHVTTVSSVILLLVTLIGIVAAPLLILVAAPGFAKNADKFELTVSLTRITFPYILFISLVAISSGILNTWSRFSIPAITPVLLNISFIAMALFAAPWFNPPALALAWAVFIGGILQLLLQLPALWKIRMLPIPQINLLQSWRTPGVQNILKLMIPAVLGVSVTQISLLINTMFASSLGDGYVSWLYFADRLMEFPAALLGVALSTILLPSLSHHHTNNASEEYSRTLDWGLRLSFLLAMPAAVGLIMLAFPLVSTLFLHGAFSVHDAERTSEALIAYGVGLVGLILVKILAPGFYAKQNIKTPVKIALISLAATQIMNLLFIGWLKHTGLALSIGLAACLNAALLYRGLRKQAVYLPLPGWRAFLIKLLCALFLMSITLWLLRGQTETWVQLSTLGRIWQLLIVILSGASVYFAALWLQGLRISDFKWQITRSSDDQVPK